MLKLLVALLPLIPAAFSAGDLPSHLKKAILNDEFSVSYKVTGKTLEGVFEGETRWFKKGKKFRTDMLFHGGETRSYQLGNSYYTCFRLNGTWQCVEYPASLTNGKQGRGEFYTLEDLTKEKLEVEEISPRIILGEKTHCYTIKSKEQSSNVCVNDKGIVLLMEVKTAEGTYIMKATKYSDKVKDSVFNLPAKPSKLPALPGIPQMQQN